jgi:hypothetical protein
MNAELGRGGQINGVQSNPHASNSTQGWRGPKHTGIQWFKPSDQSDCSIQERDCLVLRQLPAEGVVHHLDAGTLEHCTVVK